MSRHTPIGLALLLVAACHGRTGQAAPDSCEPTAEDLSPSMPADSLAGSYRLRLVAADAAETTVAGTLTLLRAAAEHQHRPGPAGTADTTHRYPLIGAADADLASLRAVAPGGIASLDPAAPGVLVIERTGGPPGAPGRILLRLGSDANRADQVRFDGGYTILRVRRADERGFVGGWESGSPRGTVSGHFCAQR